jgi:hypothetical protein
MFSYDHQDVSDIAHFVKGSLMTFSLWPPASEWHYIFCEMHFHHCFPLDNSMWVRLDMWKPVSSHLFLWSTVCKWHWTFVTGSLINVFLCPTGSEWHWTFWERQSHHMFSHDQQLVCDIGHFVKGCLITCFPMTNSEWVALHILCKPVSSHVFLWPTVCQWH